MARTPSAAGDPPERDAVPPSIGPGARGDAEACAEASAEAARLDALAGLIAGGSTVAGPVLVAVVHGELLATGPFGSASGVVARAAARLTAISTGLDPKGLAVPEVGHLRAAGEYRAAAGAFAAGGSDGLSRWFGHCTAAWLAGAREGLGIAAAAAE